MKSMQGYERKSRYTIEGYKDLQKKCRHCYKSGCMGSKCNLYGIVRRDRDSRRKRAQAFVLSVGE